MRGENRKRRENTRGTELTGTAIRALALAVICNLFIFASNELVILWEALLAPVIHAEWSWEKTSTIIGKIDIAHSISTRLADIEYIAIGAMVFSACLLFGFWNAARSLTLIEYQQKLKETNKRLHELSVRDDLTGLGNQRYLKEHLDVELDRGRRYHRPLTLLMLDVDYYKNVNDRFGHIFGDHVLSQLAGILKDGLRSVDVLARYGGDEFVIILPETDAKGALIVCQRIRKSVEDHVLALDGIRARITVSIGAACCMPNESLVKSELMRRADEALYISKQRGRNTVSIWRKGFSAGPPDELADPKGNRKLEEAQKKLYALAQEAKESSDEPIFALAAALEAKDNYTQRHSIAVMSVATNIARALLLPEEEVEQIRHAALLHDIGKIGIGEELLSKEGPLSEGERAVIRQHPVIGASILAPIRYLRGLVPMVKHHHEQYDGGGYPSGLAGEEIPLGARILAVADSYCAMTSDRPYSSAKPYDEACKEIRAMAGSQFDPHVVEAFVEAILLPTHK